MDNDVGNSPVGPAGIFLLTIVFAAEAVLLLIALVQIWPTATTTTASTRHHVLQVFDFSVSAEVNLILLAIVGGALGGVAHSLRSVSWYIGNRNLKRSWLPFYLLLPFVAAILAFALYVVLHAGFVTTQGNTTSVTPYSATAIGLLVGLFSSQAAEKLKQVFETILTKAPAGSDHTPAPAATISAIAPDHAKVGSDIAISGSGLAGATAVLFGSIPASALETRSDAELRVVVPPGAQTAPITVTTPQGKATSKTFTVDP